MGEVLKRAGLDGDVLDQIIFGNIFANLDQNVSRLLPSPWTAVQGPGYTISSACIFAALAIIQGCNAIATGQADVVLAGGDRIHEQCALYAGDCAGASDCVTEVGSRCPFGGASRNFPIGGGMGLAAEKTCRNVSHHRKSRMSGRQQHRRGSAGSDKKTDISGKERSSLRCFLGRGKTTTVYDDEGPVKTYHGKAEQAASCV